MKTTRTLGLYMAFAAILFVSCKKADQLTTTEDASKKSIVLVNSGAPIELPDCSSTCIDPAGPYIEASGSETQNWGNSNNPHSKTVNWVAYNTPASFVVKVTFTHSGGNSSNTVSVTAFGSTQSVTTLASGTTATFTFNLPNGWSACNNVPFSIYQEGQNSPVNLSCSYNLYGVCPEDGCITTFTGEAISCGSQREAVYSFTSENDQDYIKIQGGLTNFTGADAEVIVSDAALQVSQWTPGGGTNRVIKVEGSVDACQTITIRIRWNSTNSGGIITGDWSVKDDNGVELAPPVAGLTCN
jgi:hypothetical protein